MRRIDKSIVTLEDSNFEHFFECFLRPRSGWVYRASTGCSERPRSTQDAYCGDFSSSARFASRMCRRAANAVSNLTQSHPRTSTLWNSLGHPGAVAKYLIRRPRVSSPLECRSRQRVRSSDTVVDLSLWTSGDDIDPLLGGGSGRVARVGLFVRRHRELALARLARSLHHHSKKSSIRLRGGSAEPTLWTSRRSSS